MAPWDWKGRSRHASSLRPWSRVCAGRGTCARASCASWLAACRAVSLCQCHFVVPAWFRTATARATGRQPAEQVGGGGQGREAAGAGAQWPASCWLHGKKGSTGRGQAWGGRGLLASSGTRRAVLQLPRSPRVAGSRVAGLLTLASLWGWSPARARVSGAWGGLRSRQAWPVPFAAEPGTATRLDLHEGRHLGGASLRSRPAAPAPGGQRLCGPLRGEGGSGEAGRPSAGW